MTRWSQFIRFATVGLGATALHTTVAWPSITQFGLSSVEANALGFVIATGFSFVANSRWSFSSQPSKKRLVIYLTISLICLLVTILSSLIAQEMRFPPITGIALVISTTTPLGFFLHRRYTYQTPT